MIRQMTCHKKSDLNSLFTSRKLSYDFTLEILLFLLFFLLSCTLAIEVEGYSNQWAVEIQGGEEVANEVAYTHGFINHGKILQDEDFYIFSHPKLRKRSVERSSSHHSNLVSHEKVLWAEQQLIKRRVKRDFRYDPHSPPHDPEWPNMWYMLSISERPSMRVMEAWQAGYSGKNVSVTILDDGIELTHPDLKDNYDPLASGDINNHDNDPSPRLNPTNENRHGTRCAGEVAAVANNNICSVGIAYNGKIGGVRMLDGQVTDAVEAASIGFRPDHVDIYSASWGPDDDGKTVDGPAQLARKAFSSGVAKGRNGKGSIFVWASGNGGRHQDNCNCDGYTNSIYTLSISSTTENGRRPWYSESCSSTLAATYSSGSVGEKQVVTTDLRHTCTRTHTGTSASAPLAAAICALALEANPALTWRDMQHLVVRTARSDGLNANDWVVNGVNRKVSHSYGYGLMDAYGMVKMAKKWTLVPPQRKCVKTVVAETETPRIISSSGPIVVPVQFSACDNGNEMIERLEHVQAELTLRNERRGDLSIFLTSPQGTRSTLLATRRQDFSSQGFTKWAFMSTHSWDENPKGIWNLEIHDNSVRPASGTLSLYNLILYGTRHSDWPEAHRPVKSTASSSATATSTSTTTPGSSTASQEPLYPTVRHSRLRADNAAEAEAVISITTTTLSTTTDSTTSNCKLQLDHRPGCLVCRAPAVMEPESGKCVKTCKPNHYPSEEKVNEKGEMTQCKELNCSSTEYIELDEGREKFYLGYVCRPCPPYCRICAGPPLQCHQCVKGANFQWISPPDFVCMPDPKHFEVPPSIDKVFVAAVGIIVLAFVFFFGLFCYCRIRHSNDKSCCGSSKGSYISLSNEVDKPYSDVLEYRDEPEYFQSPKPTRTTFGAECHTSHHNGSIKNEQLPLPQPSDG